MQLLHRLRAVIHHLEKQRPSGIRYSGQTARDHVIDKFWQELGGHRSGHVRIEDLEKMLESLALRFETKPRVFLQGSPVALGIIVERYAVQPEVRTDIPLSRLAIDMAALNMIDSRRSKRH